MHGIGLEEDVRSWFDPYMYVKYGHIFDNVWASSAYKGASSETLTIDGDRYLLLQFTGQTLYDAAGKSTYTGPDDLKPTPAIALAEARLTDASEGTIAFVVGYDSLPCPTLNVTNTKIDLVLPH